MLVASRSVGSIFALAVVCFMGVLPSPARADGVDVPIALQVGLLRRLASYDRTLPSRSHGTLRVLVVSRRGDGLSERVAGQLEAQVLQAAPIIGLPVVVARHSFVSSAALLTALADSNAGIVYFGPGMSNVLPGLATALAGREVLTVSTVGSDAALGAMVSFELDASRPRIVVNLGQARRQHIELSSQLLRLVRVIP